MQPSSSCSTDFDALYDFVGNDGPVFYFLTDRDAPRLRVVAIDVTNPAPDALADADPRSGRRAAGRGPGRRPLHRELPAGRP